MPKRFCESSAVSSPTRFATLLYISLAGQILRASRDADMSAFSAGEVEQAKRVAEFANGFRTATALTQASHSGDAWRDTASGELIPYAKAATLRRM